MPIQSPARDSVLREAMVAELEQMGAIRGEPVAGAMRTVPRHLFVPGEPLELAYEPDTAVAVKRDGAGRAVSLLSSAHIQATMLEQAQVQLGMRVLEIGSGGYNAALLAELAGPGPGRAWMPPGMAWSGWRSPTARRDSRPGLGMTRSGPARESTASGGC